MIDYLIAGLGNPGDKYSKTRHNIGWMVANALNIKFDKKWKKAGIYLFSEFSISNKKILNILPLTYMNNSGEAIHQIKKKYNIQNENIIVIVDEYNFPLGKIHVKKGGSAGGHNGIASIIEYLEDNDFIKLRCGIGKDFPPGGMVNYVLSNFPEEQYSEVIKMTKKSTEAIEHIVKNKFSKAMSDINSESLWKNES